MKRYPLLILMLFVASGITAWAATPFASGSEPHGTLYLNGSPRAQDLYPVRVRAIDGHLTVRENLRVLRLKPGTYTLKLRLENIQHMENLNGMLAGSSNRKQQDKLNLTVEPGKTYYIAGKVAANGNWQPVVWKTGSHD